MALVGVIAISVIILAAVAAYAYFSKPSGSASQLSNSAQVQSVAGDPELTSTDSIDDIDRDLSSTQVDNLDKDIVGVSSQVQ